jgi:D-glycero-alpha-D-manno-heptose-7-phosphate kinase
MLLTRTPLRISLGGGGSDLPSYYREHGAFFVSAAIDKYIYIGLNKTFNRKYFIRYQQQELVDRVESIVHPFVREALLARDPGPVEIVSLADIPAGTGLGSSGSFAVGLLRTLHAHANRPVTPAALAEEACDIEINRLKEPVGKQDQYIAAYGGIHAFEIDRSGTVSAVPMNLPQSVVYELEDRLLLFFTGYSRSANNLLGEQDRKSIQGDRTMMSNIGSIVEIGKASAAALRTGDLKGFGELMDHHWRQKRQRSSSMSNGNIDRWYDKAMENGAVGGKLVGAGGGGFLMFYANDPVALRAAMAEEGLEEIRFKFDFDGASVLTRG